MKIRMLIMLLIVAVFLGGSLVGRDLLFKGMAKKYMLKPAATPVQVAIVKNADWRPSLDAVGTLRALHGVNLSAELSGQVDNIYFKNGQMVQKGQLLLRLDDAADIQELKNLQAQLVLAKSNFRRQQSLYKTGAVAPSDFDAIRAKMQQMSAMVKKQQALLAMKSIRAPFAGRVGISNVRVGEYVAAGTYLVTLQTLDPLYVQFSLPEQNIPQLHVGQPVAVSVDSADKKVFMGHLTAINAVVDEKTRSILLQATVPNKQHVLYPGSFASIHVQLAKQAGMLSIPQTAVNYSLYGDNVYLLHESAKGKYIVQQQAVGLGDRRGSEVAVLRGLKPGEQIVAVGQLRINAGAQVIPTKAAYSTASNKSLPDSTDKAASSAVVNKKVS